MERRKKGMLFESRGNCVHTVVCVRVCVQSPLVSVQHMQQQQSGVPKSTASPLVQCMRLSMHIPALNMEEGGTSIAAVAAAPTALSAAPRRVATRESAAL